MKKIEIHCKKAFKGKIDIRSTFIEQAKAQKSPILVTCDVYPNQASLYQVSELDNPIKIQGPFNSKFQNSTYSLYVFNWKNNYTSDDNQLNLFK